MSSFVVDSNASTVILRTKAEGLFSRLAHDLELAAARVTGTATETDGEVQASLKIPVNAIQVVGALHGGRVDRSVLSASDHAEIEHKLRDEALAGIAQLEIGVTGGRARVALQVRGPHGTDEISAPLRVEETGDGLTITSAFSVSLKALGVPPVKAPLGAFKLADKVEVHVSLKLRPE